VGIGLWGKHFLSILRKKIEIFQLIINNCVNLKKSSELLFKFLNYIPIFFKKKLSVLLSFLFFYFQFKNKKNFNFISFNFKNFLFLN
jgi:hypothetical protein